MLLIVLINIKEYVMKILIVVQETTLLINLLIYVLIVNIFNNIACPASEVTFGNPLTKLCVRECPDNPNAVANN